MTDRDRQTDRQTDRQNMRHAIRIAVSFNIKIYIHVILVFDRTEWVVQLLQVSTNFYTKQPFLHKLDYCTFCLQYTILPVHMFFGYIAHPKTKPIP